MGSRHGTAAILVGAAILLGPALVVSAPGPTEGRDAAATARGAPTTGAAPARDAPAAGGTELLRGVVSHLSGDRDEVRRFSYVESAVIEKRGPDGGLRSRSIEVYEIFPRDGQLMRRALSIDPGQDTEGTAALRREESRFLPPARTVGTGAAKPVKDGAFDAERLVTCFRFENRGADAIMSRRALKVAFTPLDGCLDDGSRVGRLLQNLSGTLWIDESDQDVLRIEGRIDGYVTFGFGILGRVDEFTLRVDREAVAPGIYTMTHMDYRARGAAFLFHKFDVTSIRERSAFVRLPGPDSGAPGPDQARHDPPSPPPR